MIRKFLLNKKSSLLKQLTLYIQLVYICGFGVTQIALFMRFLNGGPLIFVWERWAVTKGIEVFSIAAIGLVIHIFWKEWQAYRSELH